MCITSCRDKKKEERRQKEREKKKNKKRKVLTWIFPSFQKQAKKSTEKSIWYTTKKYSIVITSLRFWVPRDREDRWRHRLRRRWGSIRFLTLYVSHESMYICITIYVCIYRRDKDDSQFSSRIYGRRFSDWNKQHGGDQ